MDIYIYKLNILTTGVMRFIYVSYTFKGLVIFIYCFNSLFHIKFPEENWKVYKCSTDEGAIMT